MPGKAGEGNIALRLWHNTRHRDQLPREGQLRNLAALRETQQQDESVLRATGESAWFGWTNSPRIEELRAAWVDAPDLATQKRIAADIQRQCWIDVPHLPLGIWYQPMAWRNTITGIPEGFPLFWGAQRV